MRADENWLQSQFAAGVSPVEMARIIQAGQFPGRVKKPVHPLLAVLGILVVLSGIGFGVMKIFKPTAVPPDNRPVLSVIWTKTEPYALLDIWNKSKIKLTNVEVTVPARQKVDDNGFETVKEGKMHSSPFYIDLDPGEGYTLQFYLNGISATTVPKADSNQGELHVVLNQP